MYHTSLKSLPMTFSYWPWTTFFHSFQDSMRALRKFICAPIICCTVSPGLSGNHVFIHDIRLRMIGTAGPVFKLPFIVEWNANLQKKNKSSKRKTDTLAILHIGIVLKLVKAKRKLIPQKKTNPQFICRHRQVVQLFMPSRHKTFSWRYSQD